MEEEKNEAKQDNEKDKKARKKKIVLTLSILIILFGGIYFIYELLNFQSTDDAYVETTTVDVAPKVSGEITNVYVEDNQCVKAGDLVATIETNDYEIKLAQAKARYERALLNQNNAKANYNAYQSQIDLAKRDLDRYKSLYDDGAVSKQELDNAQTKYDNAVANMVNADQAVMSGNEKNKVADAEINELKALMSQAELYLSYTNIYAPIDGTVSSKRVEKGMYVNPGTGLFTIVPHKTWVVANYKENQLRHIKEGQIVDIKIDTYPHHTFKGKVDSIQMASGAKSSMFPPENAVGSFVKIVQRVPVKIIFTDEEEIQDYKIIPGMSVVPKVHIRG
ncbi:MAG: HlyD family secretion protein [Candidatus Gastranaerophilales bacterium]|nr:HlyD family secretion protein [Candidatus Gastranaerophilales bacterium]